MTLRRPAALAAALVLGLSVAACSDDDDGAEPPSTTTTTTATSPEPELLTVELEGRPSAATVSLGLLWVVSDDDPDARVAGGVRRYDLQTGRRVAPGSDIADPVAVVPIDGGVWTIGATGVLTKLETTVDDDTVNNVVSEVDLGGALVDAVIAGDRLWVADIGRSLVHVLDPETGEVVEDPVPVEAGAVRLAAAGERIWVSGTEDQVTPIDVAAAVARQPVQVGNAPIGLVVVNDVLWVANSDDDTVTRISLETGQAVGEPIAVGDAPIAIAAAGDGVWVLNQDDPSLLRLDAETGEPVGAPVALPMRPRGMAVTAAGVWVVGVDPSVAVLNASQ